MKLAVLTTETYHHTYFVQEVQKTYEISAVLIETHLAQPVFQTFHPFEALRDDYERNVFFDGHNRRLSDIVYTYQADSVNNPSAVAFLKDLSPDVIVVFGTGPIKQQVIQLARTSIVNLHGGDPEAYRGLDTHLWAIYHNDFEGLVTTLHRLNPLLDDGDIILQAPIPLKKRSELHQLRHGNTDVCIQLTLAALSMYERIGCFVSRPQRKKGRYYSFMPAPLKEVCLKNLERYQGAQK
jgi:methionyl-tRNA formyltransferase